MKVNIEERVLEIAEYLIYSKATVRVAARNFGCSKSTVHKDMAERLPGINPSIATQVREILDINKADRHIRGGEATKLRYSRNETEAYK